MANCDLDFRLEGGGLRFHSGDPVRGTLAIRAHGDVEANGVKIRLFWRTHGKGNRDTGGEMTSGSGPLRLGPGDTEEVPFDFVMPPGPVTCDGHFVSVAWVLRAELDVSWARDPNTELDLVVLPAPPEASAGQGYRGAPRRIASVGADGLARVKGQAGLLQKVIPLGVATLIIAMMGNQVRQGMPPVFVAVSGGAVLAIVGLAYRSHLKRAKSAIAARRLGTPEIQVNPCELPRGEAIEVQVRLQPQQQVLVERVVVKLSCTEIAVSGSGTSRTTHTHVAHEDAEIPVENRLIAAGESVPLVVSLRVPEGQSQSFTSGSNDIVWRIDVDVAIAGWPDYHQAIDVTVH